VIRTKLFVLAAAILGAMTLSGCNLVMSPTPVFTTADAAGAPPLKSGVWASPDKDCKLDEAKPAAEWPSCASGAIIKDGKAWAVGHADKATPYVLAAGEPRVMQAVADISDVAGQGVTVSQKGPIYMFIALKPVSHDDAGAITRAEAWFIQCGPPPAKPKDGSAASNDPKAYGTKHPLPGMTMDNGECSPKDKAAVRGAAGPSRAWADPVMEMHWVRGGEN
jgi:hypothetical protein